MFFQPHEGLHHPECETWLGGYSLGYRRGFYTLHRHSWCQWDRKPHWKGKGALKFHLCVRGSAKKPCWQLQTPQSVCAFSGSPSPSRTACEFQSRPSPGFNWIFFKRSVLSNKYITFETLFHNKLISRSSWMPYCVLKRKKRIPDSQNIFNKHFREFPPPPETPN